MLPAPAAAQRTADAAGRVDAAPDRRRHLGRERVIGCWQVGTCWSTPGRARACRRCSTALGDERPRALLLTHIHLDHAGATGSLVQRWPELEVYVHERGAPHMVDPRG